MANITYRGASTSPGVNGSTVAANTPLSNLQIDKNWASLNAELITKAPTASPEFSGTVRVGSADFRLKANTGTTGYGTILRNDGVDFYILTTALNDANGTWTGPIPFKIALATGIPTLNSPNINTPAISGGTITSSAISGGTIANPSITGTAAFNGFINYTATGTKLPDSGVLGVSDSAAGMLITSQGTGATAGASYVAFHRPGSYAAHFGIDTDNKWKVGGWSMGAVSYEIFHAGNTKTVNGQSILGSGDLPIYASSSLGVNVVTTTSVNPAWSNWHYILTNVATTTITLPPIPAAGAIVWVTVANGLSTNIIARNGSTIMGLAEDMVIDDPYVTVRLRYVNSTWRLV